MKKKYLFEFDFIAFFNKVDPKWVHQYLETRSWELAELIMKVVFGVIYKFEKNIKKLPRESEIRVRGEGSLPRKNAVRKPLIVRSGLPQGLSFSPILATLVLELLEEPEGLVMCADDGLILTDVDKEDQVVK